MLEEQVRRYLLDLFSFTFGSYCMVVLDISVEAVWRTTILGVPSFIFCRCDIQLSFLFQRDIPYLILSNQIFSFG